MYTRPPDPQAREAGQLFKEKNIDYVLTSPFLRCLQTSAEIVDELGLAQGRWLVVWPMCEVRAGAPGWHHRTYAGRGRRLLPMASGRSIAGGEGGGGQERVCDDPDRPRRRCRG